MGTKHEKTVLTIAGSDPSGGAGIQADIKTFTTLGVYSAAAITCLTIQNTRGVFSFQPVETGFFRKQVITVLEDISVSHIKIGMTGSYEIAATLGEILAEFPGPVVFDPVLVASSGHDLAAQDALLGITDRLLPRVSVLSPNISELETLSGSPCPDGKNAIEAAVSLLEKHANLQAVIIKGGHLDETIDTVTDHLVLRNKESGFAVSSVSHPRIRPANFHGTGCTFASAFTAFHLFSGNYTEAFSKTIRFMTRLLEVSAGHSVGQGRIPLAHHLMTAE